MKRTKQALVSYIKFAGMLLCGAFLFMACAKESPKPEEDDKAPTEESKQLVLTASSQTATVGEEVTFEVTVEGQEIAADIYIDNKKIEDDKHSFNLPGNYKIVAKREGYMTSDEVVIDVIESQYNTDVYVLGWKIDQHGQNYGKYWKNGVAVPLPNIPDAWAAHYGVFPYSIFVSGDDVHVVGNISTGGDTYPIYWKNGVPTLLSEQGTTGRATAIFVYNGDVHVAGSLRKPHIGARSVATHFINGVPHPLTDGTSNASAGAIYVSAGDVYVAGSDKSEYGEVPKYWKNGSPIPLTYERDIASPHTIIVSNDNIYIAGYDGILSQNYWVNGELKPLHHINDIWRGITPTDMFIYDDDVYVSGQHSSSPRSFAAYWKNGQPVRLSDGTTREETSSIFVHEGDVYVAGHEEVSGLKSIAKYWKNGEEIYLTDGQNFVKSTSIFVTKTLVK